MSEPIDERLRRGLAGAADALPPHEPQPLPDRPGPRRGRAVVAAAATLAVLGAVGTGVVLARDTGDDAEPGVVAADDDTETPPETGEDTGDEDAATTTVPADQVSAANGNAPGRAVATDTEILLFGPDGEPTGTVDLAPIEWSVQAVAADLDGGWVVCGMDGENRDRWMWFPADGEPVEFGDPGDPVPDLLDVLADEGLEFENWEELDEYLNSGGELPDSVDAGMEEAAGLDPDGALSESEGGDGGPDGTVPLDGDPVVDAAGSPGPCMADAVQVVDSVHGPVLVHAATADSAFGTSTDLAATVLATGHTYDLAGPDADAEAFSMTRTFATGRVAWTQNGRVHLADLDTGEQLPVADIPADGFAELSLAPDASSVAVADGPVDGPVDVTVHDLETGDQVFSNTFDRSLEGFEFSYDGELLAVGGFYEGQDPVEVMNLDSGDRHTLDAHGVLP